MKNKKMTGAVFAVTLAALLLMAGCGGESPSEKPQNVTITQAPAVQTEQSEQPAAENTGDVSPSEIANEIIGSVQMSSLAEIGEDRIGNYLELDMGKIESFSMYISGSGGFADEIAVFALSDESYSADVEAALKARADSRAADFKDYNADEYDKLIHAVIKTKGKYVFFAVTGDNAAAESIFDTKTGG